MTPAELRDRAAAIRLALFDVDGVFTDGRLYYSADGGETKTFHTHDGHGIKLLLASGINVGIISGRTSPAVARRMRELGIEHVHQGVSDKLAVLRELLERTGTAPAATAFVGDDLPDIPVLQRVGLAVAVADAHPAILPAVHYTTRKPGGFGAVREVCDLIVAAVAGQPLPGEG